MKTAPSSYFAMGAERSKSVGGWFVTFGDLLTLLLCFFVVTVAQAPQAASVVSAKDDAFQGVAAPLESASAPTSADSQPGTPLAKNTFHESAAHIPVTVQERSLRELVLVKGEFLPTGAIPAKLLKEQRVGEASSIEVELCGEPTGGSGWGEMQEQARAIARQLSDTAPRAALRVRMIGAHCRLIAVPPYQEVRARIRVSGSDG